jgi:hypothetical protein
MKPKRTANKHRPIPVDPRAILEAIAADPRAAPTARVQACKALLALDAVGDASDGDGVDELTRKAIEMGRRSREI